MEEYKKRIPLLLGLGISIILGMFFLHNDKKFTEVIHILVLVGVLFYYVGVFVINSVIQAQLHYLDQKNSEIYSVNKEGKKENVENIDTKDIGMKENQSSFDVSIEGNADEFVELAKNISKEKN
jgi:hypothetical protein